MNDPRTQTVVLRGAGTADVDVLLPLVRAYHHFEQVSMTDAQRLGAMAPLLAEDSALGRIWLIEDAGLVVGYVAVCFGYSIEFMGRDAFIDELFLVEQARGRGIGSAVLEHVKRHVTALGIVAVHLEVARDNDRARRLYGRTGFQARERFHLMSWHADSAS